jgi:hypothetical protein
MTLEMEIEFEWNRQALALTIIDIRKLVIFFYGTTAPTRV